MTCPDWCDPLRCLSDRVHRGSLVRLADGATRVQVWIQQRPGELPRLAVGVGLPSSFTAAGTRALVEVMAALAEELAVHEAETVTQAWADYGSHVRAPGARTCDACGRPGPCVTWLAARDLLAGAGLVDPPESAKPAAAVRRPGGRRR